MLAEWHSQCSGMMYQIRPSLVSSSSPQERVSSSGGPDTRLT